MIEKYETLLVYIGLCKYGGCRMANKQIYQFPSQKTIPMKAALYLFGHGPYREP
jgi:hypothetical protein